MKKEIEDICPLSPFSYINNSSPLGRYGEVLPAQSNFADAWCLAVLFWHDGYSCR